MKKTTPFLLVLLCMCLLLSGCISINSQIPAIATDPNGNVVTKPDNSGYQVNYYNINDAPDASFAPDMQSQPVQQTQPTQPVADTTAQQNADEANLNLFNTAVNRVKAESAGFTKSKQTVGTNMQLSNPLVNAVANALKDSLLPNDTTVTTVLKGQPSIDIMYPPGQTFVSALTLADIQSITAEQNGSDRIITVYLADETNPDAVNSAYAKIFEFITVDDIMNIYAPNMNATVNREDVFFDFKGCYAKATIGPDGNLKSYETFVSGTMRLTNGKIRAFTTDLSILLSSTTTFTDFQW